MTLFFLIQHDAFNITFYVFDVDIEEWNQICILVHKLFIALISKLWMSLKWLLIWKDPTRGSLELKEGGRRARREPNGWGLTQHNAKGLEEHLTIVYRHKEFHMRFSHREFYVKSLKCKTFLRGHELPPKASFEPEVTTNHFFIKPKFVSELKILLQLSWSLPLMRT